MSDAEDQAGVGEGRAGKGKDEGGSGAAWGEGRGKNHNKYRKDKPWDNASIDHWAIPDWKDETIKVRACYA